MPTKKGKSKPAKAKKVSNKTRRSATGKSKPAGTAKKSAAGKSAGRRKAAGKLRRTEAGPVWIGSSPAPVNLPREDPGSNKVTGAGSERVRIM